MQRLLIAAVCCILQVALSTAIFAQAVLEAPAQPIPVTPAQQNFRWMEYDSAIFIPSSFQTIIGQHDEGPLAADSKYYSPTVRIPARFGVPFLILGDRVLTNSEINQHIEASVAGFFKFTRDEEPIFPYSLVSYSLERCEGPLTRLIMPYWGKLESVDVQGGGIYYRYFDEDPLVDGPDKLVIEWRVRPVGLLPPVILGFQAHVIIRHPCPPLSTHYATIEFHYGSAPDSFSWLNVPGKEPDDFRIGAAVGLKNQGQKDQNDAPGAYAGTPGTDEGIDDQNTLMLPPDYVLRDGDNDDNNVGITRVPVYLVDPPVPELFATTPRRYGMQGSPYSPFFHLKFPKRGYKIKPVDNDLLTLGPVPGGSGDSSIFIDSVTAINPGEFFQVRCRFLYAGCAIPRDIVTTAIVLQGGKEVDRVQDIIRVLQPGADTLINFPKKFGGPLYKPGTYELVVFHNYRDDVRSNDTARIRFLVRARRDFGPVELVEPVLKYSSERSVFRYRSTIRIKARFANTGLTTVRNIPVGYRILNHRGRQVHAARLVLRGTYAPGKTAVVTFPNWRPDVSGTYYIEVYSALSGDDITDNDTLQNMRSIAPPGREWAGSDFKILHVPSFEVRPAVDIEVLGSGAHDPATGSVVKRSFTPRLFFRNNGGSDARNVPVQVAITNLHRLVSSRTIVIPEIKAGHVVEFPLGSTDINTVGQYCIAVAVKMPGDQVNDNDRTQWCFKGQR